MRRKRFSPHLRFRRLTAGPSKIRAGITPRKRCGQIATVGKSNRDVFIALERVVRSNNDARAPHDSA